jgi:hypothetical protein
MERVGIVSRLWWIRTVLGSHKTIEMGRVGIVSRLKRVLGEYTSRTECM